MKCYLPLTRTEIISDTVRLIPKHIPIPEVDADDYLRTGVQELIHLLWLKKDKIPGTKSDVAKNALIKLAQILQRDSCKLADSTLAQKHTAATTFLHNIPNHPQVVTSEGAKHKFPVKIPSITDEDFEQIKGSLQSPTTSTNLQNKIHHVSRTSQFNLQTNKAQTILLSRAIKAQQANYIFDLHGRCESIDTLLNGPDAEVWTNALNNELGQLAQGINTIKGV